MPDYKNGEIPASKLVVDRHGNPWLPGTYQKWVRFQKAVHDRTGVWLYVSPFANGAHNAYRSYREQLALRAYWKSIGRETMASVPGRSSHGGLWSGQTNGRYGLPGYIIDKVSGAFDVYNFDEVPWNVFAECAEAEGLLVNVVVPKELWHVVDLDPWNAPATAGIPATSEEDDMPNEEWMSGFGNALREQITGDVKRMIEAERKVQPGWLSGFGNALRTQIVGDIKKLLGKK